MSSHTRFVHLLDDLAMGGVTRALNNFKHPEIESLGTHETVDITRSMPHASSRNDVAIVHFTASWKKLPHILDLRLRGKFSKKILIEHTYTRGFESSEVIEQRRFRRMLKVAYQMVDKIVAVSEVQRKWIISCGLAPAYKVVAIPQSRDCTGLLKLPVPIRNRGPLKIGAFGRFHKQKGFDLLIEAMAQIPPEIATLKIAGAGPDKSDLEAQASKLRHVTVHGAFKSPAHFLSSVDVVAIPSRWEAFGLVGTEARAAGRPIIASRVDGLLDQITDNCFSHSCGDKLSIEHAILEAASATDIPARGMKLRAEAASEFDAMIAYWKNELSQGRPHSIAA